jgi:hypothetical protein
MRTGRPILSSETGEGAAAAAAALALRLFALNPAAKVLIPTVEVFTNSLRSI